MVRYPVRVQRDYYRGRNERRRAKQREHNNLAERLEKYLNQRIEEDPAPVQTYIYGYIAHDLGLPVEDVKKVLFSVDCGHNGLTVLKEEIAEAPGRDSSGHLSR